MEGGSPSISRFGGKERSEKGRFFTFPVDDHLPGPSYRAIHKKNETLGVKNTSSLRCYILSLRRKPPKSPIRFFSRVKRLQLVLQRFAFWLVYRFLCLLWLVKVCTLYFCFDSNQPKSTNHKRRETIPWTNHTYRMFPTQENTFLLVEKEARDFIAKENS